MDTKLFDPIELKQMDQVKLMHRTDKKYWFNADHLNELLKMIGDNYFLLQIDNQSIQSYASTYYDTNDNMMFTQHHNGKLNRFKVRRRSYLSSGVSFLEVKIKSNKGKTKKKRIQTEYGQTIFTEYEQEFLSRHIPFEYTDLHLSLNNEFSRITLVNKNFRERCTIDLDLQFQLADKIIPVHNLVIVEIKSDGREASSPLMLALRDQHIKTSGFSKYCVGRTLTDPKLKRNNFKRKIRSIEKTIHTDRNLYNLN